MIIAFTGHRPNKFAYGYQLNNPMKSAIERFIGIHLAKSKIRYPDLAVITGMAVGVDQWAAQICVQLGIPFDAYVPFKGQETKWMIGAQEGYKNLLANARNIVYCSEPGYAAWKMQVRNEMMVDHCDLLVGIWDGSDGGTANCIRYASETSAKRELAIKVYEPDWILKRYGVRK